MADIDRAVITNGLDFLESAVEHLANDRERDLSYAAMHLNAAVETLLKARLAREHWTLVVENVDQARRSRYEEGDIRGSSKLAGMALWREYCPRPAVVTGRAWLRGTGAGAACGPGETGGERRVGVIKRPAVPKIMDLARNMIVREPRAPWSRIERPRCSAWKACR